MKASQQSWPRSLSPAGDRRRAPRCDAHLGARLLFSLSLQESEDSAQASAASPLPRQLEGYTRNISETGLALIVPSTGFDGNYFNDLSRTLRIMLELPTGTVRVSASPTRCEPLDEKGYLVGVRITEMSDGEWVKLVQYVRMLRATPESNCFRVSA